MSRSSIELISASMALSLLSECVNQARGAGSAPLAFVVLDARGHVVGAVSEEGCGLARHDIARSKAQAAMGMGINTADLQMYEAKGVLPSHFLASIGPATGKGFVATAGGVLIHLGGRVIGALGVSGASSQVDHQVAVAAIGEWLSRNQ